MAVTRDQVAKLYVANFNRAPDAAGLDYWISDGTSATTTLTDLNAIAASMQAGAEASTGVASMTNSEYVISLYSSMFGRTVAADSADVAYWTNDITLGNVTRANMIQTLILGAEASTGSATDAAVLANKTTVGLAYADAGLNGTFSVATITADAATVTAAQADIDDLANPGSTFSLTNSATADTIIGTAGNDTITGASGTVAAGDLIIDQSTTDNDTANLVITAAYTPTNISKIENVNIDWNAFGTATVNTTGITGATAVTLTSSKVGFLGNSAVTAGASQHLVAGSGMIGTMTVTGATTAVTVDATNSSAVSVTGTGAATVNAGTSTTSVTTSGFTTATVNAGTATTISITDGGVATDTTALTVGASATITNAATGILAITTAAADKTLIIDTIGASMSIAGSHNVTINIDDATDFAAKTMTETSTGTVTLNIDDIDGAADLDAISADLITVDAASVGGALTVKNGQVVAMTTTAAAAFGLTVAGTGTADTATLRLDATQTQIITFTGIETATIAANATVSSTAVDLTIAEINAGTNDVVLTGANDVTITLVEAGELNASALTNNLIVTEDAAAAMDILGGTANNTVNFKGTTHDNNYVGQNGNDVVAFLNTTGNATALVANGTNAITANALTTGTLVATAGTGNDSVSLNGLTTGTVNLDLGNGTNTVTFGSTGNLAGANITITTGAGADTITVADDTVDATVMTLSLGEGVDILSLAKDITAGTIAITGLDVIDVGAAAAAAKVDAALLTGKAYTIKASGTNGDMGYGVTGFTDTLLVEVDVAGSYNFSSIVIDNTLADGISGLQVTGNAGNDTIVGTSGNDVIDGNDGTDSITGGLGMDVMTAGTGIDTFVIGTADNTTTAFDVIIGLATAADFVKTGTAGSATNYAELDGNFADGANVAADVATAKTDAETLMDGTVQYVFVYNTNVGNTTTNGYLFADNDLDGTADQAIVLTANDAAADFAYTNVIA